MVKWKSAVNSASISKIKDILNSNLNQIVEIRLKLEALAMLIPLKTDDCEKSDCHSTLKNLNLKQNNEQINIK